MALSIVKRDSSIISLKINIKILSKNDKIRNESIEFRDELLLLPASLDKLGKSFGLEYTGHHPKHYLQFSCKYAPRIKD